MAHWVYVNSTKFPAGAGDGNGGSTAVIDTRGTAGRKKVIVAYTDFYIPGGAAVLSDNQGNVFTPSDVPVIGAVLTSQAFVCLDANVAASHTFSVTGTGNVATLGVIVMEYDLPGGFALGGKIKTVIVSPNAAQNIKAGSITPSANDALVIAMFAGAADGTISVDSGFTKVQDNTGIGGQRWAQGIAWKDVATPSAQDPVWQWTLPNTYDERTAWTLIVFGGQALPDSAAEISSATSNVVVPRDLGQTYGTVRFNGSYGATAPASIKVKIQTGAGVQLQAFTALTNTTIAGGTWSGDLQVPQGDGYHHVVQFLDAGNAVIMTLPASTYGWGVGLIAFGVGQSHGARLVDDTPYAAPACAPCGRMLDKDGNFTTPTSNGIIALINAWAARAAGQGLGGTDVPLGIPRSWIGGAGWGVDGGGLGQYYYDGGIWKQTTTGTPFSKLMTHLNFLKGKGKPHAGIICGGSSDAVLNQPEATITADLNTTWDNILTALGLTAAQLPALVCVNATTTGAGVTDAMWEACKQTDLKFARDRTNAHLCANLYDQALVDDYHLGDYTVTGKRIGQSLANLFLGAPADGGDLQIVSAAAGTGNDVILQVAGAGATALKETDGTTDGGALTGFQYSKDNFATTVAITATAFVAGQLQIKLTLASAPTAGDTVRYMRGANPSRTNVVYDNTAPGGDTRGRPLAPTIGAVPVAAIISAAIIEAGAASDAAAASVSTGVVDAILTEAAALSDASGATVIPFSPFLAPALYLVEADGNAFFPLHIDAGESYGVDWSGVLPEGEVLIASTWTISGGLALSNQAYGDTETRVTVIAPPDSFGHQYRLTNKVTRQDGEPMARSLVLRGMWP